MHGLVPALIISLLLFYQCRAVSSSSSSSSCRTRACPARGSTGPSTDSVVMGRYVDWKYWGLAGYGIQPSDMNVSLYTHLIASVAIVSPSTGLCQLSDPWVIQQAFPTSRYGPDTNDPYKGLLNQARRMKLAYPHMKTILEVKEYQPSTALSQAIASPASRSKLVSSCVNLMLQYGLDGIHIYWDIPNYNGALTQDIGNYVQLAAAFRSALSSSSKPNATLSISLPFNPPDIAQHYDLVSMAAYLDWIMVQAFWYWGASDSVVGHFGNLSPPDPQAPNQRSGITDIDKVLGLPIAACKLIWAIPTLAMGWFMPSVPVSLSFPSLYGAGTGRAAWTGSEYGRYVDLDLQPARRGDPGWIQIWDTTAQATVYYNISNRLLITAESPQSLRGKVQAAVQRNLAGILIDDVNGDSAYNQVASVVSRSLQSLRPCPPKQTTSNRRRTALMAPSRTTTKQKITTRRRTSLIAPQRSTTKQTATTRRRTGIDPLYWTYPAMPTRINFSSSSSSSSPALSSGLASGNGTQIHGTALAQLISIDLDRSLGKYTPERIQTELRFFISDVSAALSISADQIVNCVWISTSSSTSRLSFTVLPNQSQTSQNLADRINQQMQDPDSPLRECALLQFAPSPPITIADAPVRVRQCPNRAVVSASSECPAVDDDEDGNLRSAFFPSTISIMIGLFLALLLSSIAVIMCSRRRSQQQSNDGFGQDLPTPHAIASSYTTTTVSGAAATGPVQSSVSSFYGLASSGQHLIPSTVMDYASADEVGYQQQRNQQRAYRHDTF